MEKNYQVVVGHTKKTAEMEAAKKALGGDEVS